MKRLLIIYVILVVLVLTVSPASAIHYCKDFLEPANPGGWGTSAKTWDEETTLAVSDEVSVDVWLNDCPEPILSAGFWMTYDSEKVEVVSVDAYDDNELPGPWAQLLTQHWFPGGEPGAYLFLVANFGSAFPDADGDSLLAVFTILV